jgi:hypothetical protein
VDRVLAACGGFLLAVLWFDLMFDVQVLAHRGGPLPEATLDSIATYYRRVTTDARPMTWLVAAVMLVAAGGSLERALRGDDPLWRRLLVLALCGIPIALALARVLPNAVALGARAGSLAEQSALARAICRDHLLSFASIGAFTALVLTRRRGGR